MAQRWWARWLHALWRFFRRPGPPGARPRPRPRPLRLEGLEDRMPPVVALLAVVLPLAAC